MLESLKEYQTLVRDFKAFDASLRIERPNDVARWLKEVVEWEGKFPVPTPTPYDMPENSESINHCGAFRLLNIVDRTYSE